MIPWNNGPVAWGSINGTTNVVQLWTASQHNIKEFIYWWRNLLPGEVLYDACLDFCRFTLSLPALGTNVASVLVKEWTPDGKLVVQERGFAAYTDDVDIFTQ